ncbi:MAG: hypothetical protein WC091_19080 [Sulfuricellaceae bacterium]
MTANNTANVKQWLEQSDIDYFTHFVKAWIPFNAWYRHIYTFEHENDILNKIKTDGNKIRTRFMATIVKDDPDSVEIRNQIAALHRRLSIDPLEDRKKRSISFENVCVGRNANNKEILCYYGCIYSVERQNKPVKQIVCSLANKSGVVKSTIIQLGEWDLEGIQTHADYLALQPNDRARILACYKQANPYIFRSLLAVATDSCTLQMDSYKFEHDPAAIFAGLLDVLYAMRNLLFHGELVPDPQTNRTYEPAYHLVRYLTRFIT